MAFGVVCRAQEHPLRRTQEPWTWEFEVAFGRRLLDLLMRATTFDATSYPFASNLSGINADDPEDRRLALTPEFDPRYYVEFFFQYYSSTLRLFVNIVLYY